MFEPRKQQLADAMASSVKLEVQTANKGGVCGTTSKKLGGKDKVVALVPPGGKGASHPLSQHVSFDVIYCLTVLVEVEGLKAQGERAVAVLWCMRSARMRAP